MAVRTVSRSVSTAAFIAVYISVLAVSVGFIALEFVPGLITVVLLACLAGVKAGSLRSLVSGSR